jgi:hypothetical protein
MGTMSPFMLKMGTVGTALIGPVLPANGASPEIGNQLDLTVGERTHVAARLGHAQIESAPARRLPLARRLIELRVDRWRAILVSPGSRRSWSTSPGSDARAPSLKVALRNQSGHPDWVPDRNTRPLEFNGEKWRPSRRTLSATDNPLWAKTSLCV